jgi:hypothetical protein
LRREGAAGLAVLALHAAALPLLLSRCRAPELALDLAAGATPAVVAPDGTVPDDAALPPALAARARRLVDGRDAAPGAALAPGVHRVEVEVAYRGGFRRRVGRTVLTGPLQDPAAPPCGVRLVVGQALLDQIEPLLAAEIARNLKGQYGFRRVAELDLGFAGQIDSLGERGGGIVMSATLEFSRGTVSVAVVVRPRVEGNALALATAVSAKVRVSNETAADVISFLGIEKRLDRLATDIAREEVDAALAPIAGFLAAPPPVPLEDGRTLALAYCPGAPVVVTTRGYLAVPLAVPFAPAPGGARPVALDPGPPPGAPDTPLALDLSLDAANAVLFHLWATGFLDTRLAGARLEERFNALPDVQALLTLRLAPGARLRLPPTLERGADPARPFTLAVDAGITLEDGALRTPAGLYGRMQLDLRTAPDGRLVTDPTITELAVTCEPRPGRLEPCYATIVDWARGGTADLHGPIAAEFASWFDDLVRGRGFTGFTVRQVTLTPHLADRSAWLRVGLAGAVAP